MRLLFVVPYAPTRIRTRPYNLLRALQSAGHRIELFTLYSSRFELDALDELKQLGVAVHARQQNKVESVRGCLRAFRQGAPLQAGFCWNPELANAAASTLASQNGMHIVHVEHLRGAEYARALRVARDSVARSVPIVWDSIDCISSLFQQSAQASPSLYSRLIARIELGRTRRYEAERVQEFDRILTISHLEKRELQSLVAHRTANSAPEIAVSDQITVLPPGVDLEYFQPKNPDQRDGTVLFSGKMSYHANVAAAMFLIDKIMPIVWSVIPDATLEIVGQNPPRSLLNRSRANPSRIRIRGYVPDMREYLARASLAVAPITYGAGVQNKVLEAMAMATPVVATPRAVAPLQSQVGTDVLVGEQPDEFAKLIVKLLRDPVLQRQIGKNGRRYVEQEHDIKKIAQKLTHYYEDLIKLRQTVCS